MSLPDPEPPATTVGIAATKFCHRSNRNYREKLTIVFKRPAVARESSNVYSFSSCLELL
jgi:hypothetical protein